MKIEKDIKFQTTQLEYNIIYLQFLVWIVLMSFFLSFCNQQKTQQWRRGGEAPKKEEISLNTLTLVVSLTLT